MLPSAWLRAAVRDDPATQAALGSGGRLFPPGESRGATWRPGPCPLPAQECGQASAGFGRLRSQMNLPRLSLPLASLP